MRSRLKPKHSLSPRSKPTKSTVQHPQGTAKKKRGRPRAVPKIVESLDSDEEEIDCLVSASSLNGNLSPKNGCAFKVAELESITEKQKEVFHQSPVSSTWKSETTDIPESLAVPPRYSSKRKRGRPKKKEKNGNPLLKGSLKAMTKTTNGCTVESKTIFRKASSEYDVDGSEQQLHNNSSSDDDITADTTDLERTEKDEATAASYLMVTVDDHETKSKLFLCQICNKESFTKKDCLEHIRVHTGEKPYECKFCDASFTQVTTLRRHETIHTGKKPYTCDICEKKFAIKDRLRLHMRVHTGEKPHHCPLCDRTFARRSQVTWHMRSHDKYKSKFKCDYCSSVFASYHTLKTHINSHMGIKESQCCACGKKFFRSEGMQKHIRTVHKGNKPYTCNICGKAFKGHLQQHMRLHRGVRPYTCHLCDAAFTQNSQLTVHLRIHTGERPYKCQVCGSSFAHSSACKIHMRSHTGEKPFICILCSHSFSQLPHLKKHMKCIHGTDKPYMCTICKEYFKTQVEIDAHKKYFHNISKTAEQESQEAIEEATMAKLRNRLAVLLYRISSEDKLAKFGFGTQLIDEVLKQSLKFSGLKPVSNSYLAPSEELRQNVQQLLCWTIPQETMEEYHKNNMTVDEVLEMLTS